MLFIYVYFFVVHQQRQIKPANHRDSVQLNHKNIINNNIKRKTQSKKDRI